MQLKVAALPFHEKYFYFSCMTNFHALDFSGREDSEGEGFGATHGISNAIIDLHNILHTG